MTQMWFTYTINPAPMNVNLTPNPLTGLGKEAEPCEEVKIYPPCEFCQKSSYGSTYETGSRGNRWSICEDPSCWSAARLQVDRIYNGLVDCAETRRDVLRYAIEKNKRK